MKTIKYALNTLLLVLALIFSSISFAEEVNINTANAQSIASSLNGIGIKKAEAVVAWRKEHGNFMDLAALENVKGIGPKTLEKNKENIKF